MADGIAAAKQSIDWLVTKRTPLRGCMRMRNRLSRQPIP